MSSVAYGFIKLSIVFFCRRLFVVSKRSLFSLITSGLIIVIILWSVGFFFSWVFACGTHVSANWGSRKDLVEYCSYRLRISNGYLISDLILDMMTLIVPLPVVSHYMTPFEHQISYWNSLDLEASDEHVPQVRDLSDNAHWICVRRFCPESQGCINPFIGPQPPQ